MSPCWVMWVFNSTLISGAFPTVRYGNEDTRIQLHNERKCMNKCACFWLVHYQFWPPHCLCTHVCTCMYVRIYTRWCTCAYGQTHLEVTLEDFRQWTFPLFQLDLIPWKIELDIHFTAYNVSMYCGLSIQYIDINDHVLYIYIFCTNNIVVNIYELYEHCQCLHSCVFVCVPFNAKCLQLSQ